MSTTPAEPATEPTWHTDAAGIEHFGYSGVTTERWSSVIGPKAGAVKITLILHWPINGGRAEYYEVTGPKKDAYEAAKRNAEFWVKLIPIQTTVTA